MNNDGSTWGPVFRSKSSNSALFGVTSWPQQLQLTFIVAITNRTSAAMRSCRDPETAVIHFWLPGDVRRRPQRVTSVDSGGRRDTLRPLLLLLLGAWGRCCWFCCMANLVIKINYN